MIQRHVRYPNRKAVWLTRLGVAMIAIPWTIALVWAASINPRTLIERGVIPSIVLTAIELAGIILLWWVSRYARKWPDAKPATWETIGE